MRLLIILTKTYAPIKGKYNKICFFTKNIFEERGFHLFGSKNYPVYLMGADHRGRDVFSRILFGGRVSLTIGIVGILISLSLGVIVGGIAGYYGGTLDFLLMRICEFIILIPSLYIILFLRGIFLTDISPAATFFIITVILSAIGFPGTARLIRGMVHSIKREYFVISARLDNMKTLPIIFYHILPHISTILIISAMLGIPAFILGETTLSFLGLGITEPSVSWGLLLGKNVLTIDNMKNYPWLLIPGFFLFITMLAYILLGERIRDVLDPYYTRDYKND